MVGSAMFRRLIRSPFQRRIGAAMFAMVVLLAASIQDVRTDVPFCPGIWVFFRGGLHTAICHPVGTGSVRLRIAWTGRNGAIDNIVSASVGDINFLYVGPVTDNWCGTGRN